MWEQLQDPDEALTPHLIFGGPDMGGGGTLSFHLGWQNWEKMGPVSSFLIMEIRES